MAGFHPSKQSYSPQSASKDSEPLLVKDGYLDKWHTIDSVQKFWKTYLRLKSTLLEYYIYSKKELTTGNFRVENIENVEIVSTEKFKKPFCFQVGNKEEVEYFCASSKKERDDWMKAFQRAISQRPKLEESTLLSRIPHRNTWSRIPHITKTPRERRLVQSLHSHRPLPINLDIDSNSLPSFPSTSPNRSQVIEEMPSVTEFLQHFKLSEDKLEQEFSETDLLTLSRSRQFQWRDWVERLGLSDCQVKNIDDLSPDEADKNKKTLNMWHNLVGFTATYRSLIEIFLEGENSLLAGEVCELLKECECTPLQRTFLEELRNQLKAISTFSSEDVRYSSAKEVVRDYVQKYIKAGSTSIDHLHAHLEQLYETEELISDPGLIDNAKQLSYEVLSLKKSTLLNIERSSTTTLFGEEKLATPFSKRLFYHASLCSLAVNRCTEEDNCQEFFKKQKFHSLKEVSLSHTSHEHYLIASGGDSTYYIAFQSEPDITRWPRKYKSFNEGITSQTGKFPLHFIQELLSKGRVVLTGFSFGGLLACSIATQVWLSRYLSSRHLQENLVCITFAQPHISVPQLADVAREFPEITSTIHAIYNKEDPVPRLMKFLDIPISSIIEKKRRKPPPPFEDAMTLRLAEEIGSFINQATISNLPWYANPSYELRKVVQVFSGTNTSPKQPAMIYHLLSSEEASETVFEELSPEGVSAQTSFPSATAKGEFNLKLDQHLMETYVKMIIKTCLLEAPPPVSSLGPVVTRIELHNHGSEFALAVEGSNLSFCSELSINRKEIRHPLHHISGKSIQVNFKFTSPALRSLRNGQKVEVGFQSLFTSHVRKNVPLFTKAIPTTVRQQQLAKLTPSQVIELSYLSALLEQQPFEHSKPLSDKVAAVRKFLEKIVQIIPIESIGYAVAHGNSYVAMHCNEAIEASSLTLSSMLMSDAMRSTSRRISVSRPFAVSHVPTSVICGLNLDSLYPITSSILGLKSPIDTLQHGRNRLSSLSIENMSSFLEFPTSLTMDEEDSIFLPLIVSAQAASSSNIRPTNSISSISSLYGLQESLPTQVSSSSLSNSLMLRAVNEIRQEDLAICISLITGFINQQEIGIPLLNTSHDYIRKEQFALSIWALSSLGLDDVHKIVDEHYSKEMTVRVEGYTRGSPFVCPEALPDEEYAGKLHFMVQAMQRTVSCNSQHISYSLERQLVRLCQERNITNSIPLDALIGHWDKIFEKDILSLVAKSHRPLISRWLKWALMVHDLREELAKYTAVGVIGLVNSGKSGLVSSLFDVKVSSGTTEEKRTTVPFIYNLDEKVKGLDVVDFPGVDDRDESISELADLLLTLAQIIIFVVDYRRIHTLSSKRWLERLQVEKVPVLVCLTYADKLYAEYMTDDGQHPDKGPMANELEVEVSRIRDKLDLPEEQQIMFCSFKQDIDSLLNCEEGRQTLRDVGIKTPPEVGDWLVETLKETFGQDELANQLHQVLHPFESPMPILRKSASTGGMLAPMLPRSSRVISKPARPKQRYSSMPSSLQRTEPPAVDMPPLEEFDDEPRIEEVD